MSNVSSLKKHLAKYDSNTNQTNEDLQEKCRRLEELVAELTIEKIGLKERICVTEINNEFLIQELFAQRLVTSLLKSQMEDLQVESDLMQEELDLCYGVSAEEIDFQCPRCGSRRCNAQRVDEDEGKSIERNWKDRLECADCGADPNDPGGKWNFRVTAEMLKKLKVL